MDPQLPLTTEDEPRPNDLGDRMIVVTGKQKELLDQAVSLDEQDAREAGSIGFSARLWAQVALPYRNPGELPSWKRTNGTMTLFVRPGFVKTAPDQDPVSAYPFGVVPRLLLTWMATEAVLTKDRELELGTSMRQFRKALEMSDDGRSRRRMKDQVQRLASATLTVLDTRANVLAGSNFTFADEWRLWWTDQETQEQALFPSTITLSQKFFDSIIQAPVPIDLRALAYLRRNGGGGLPIDIYIWLAHRMYRQWMRQDPTFPIPWAYLANQFGSQYKELHRFRARFLDALRNVLIAYPEAKVLVTDDGLILRPSPPPVPPKRQISA